MNRTAHTLISLKAPVEEFSNEDVRATVSRSCDSHGRVDSLIRGPGTSVLWISLSQCLRNRQ